MNSRRGRGRSHEPRRVIVVGAGGHGQVVADILLRMGETDGRTVPIGFVDDDQQLAGTTLLGLPVLGPLRDLEGIAYEAVVVAIGENAVRARICRALRLRGVKMANAVHPSAVIARDVRLGEGVMICAGVVVNTSTTVGDGAILNTACSVDHHNRIGACAHIAPGAHLGGEVTVGDQALVGIGAAVLPGRVIGAAAIVGAGAVVARDVPEGVTVVGVPARPWQRGTRRAKTVAD